MSYAKDARPAIDTITSASELRRWYWTKAELLDEVRRIGLRTAGGKFTLLDRIAHFHKTGETVFPGDHKSKVTSKFDWHSAALTTQTVITDNYKNSQNVRDFFKAQIGTHFKFNIAFMDWMKTNTDKTLGDAVAAYLEIEAAAKDPNHQTDIRDHNQFNQYTRDFLEDNPTLGMADVRHCWALKRKMPSKDGRHRYDRSDLTIKG